jgi:pectinesterase
MMLTFLTLALLLVPTTAPTTRSALRIVLVGDSTVTDESGWGLGFKRHLSADVELINLARGGRSSKSYINEGLWDAALKQRADYILIQFGHNDCPGKGPERETDPGTTYRRFMERYVDESRAAGARPVLITSLTRRKFRSDGKVHSDLFPYADVVRQIAKEKSVSLIDLHERSITVCNELGRGCVETLGPMKEDGSGYDLTHLTPRGAEVFGGIVADELRRAVPEFASHVK